jgi:hypothetical protein
LRVSGMSGSALGCTLKISRLHLEKTPGQRFFTATFLGKTEKVERVGCFAETISDQNPLH